MLLSIITFLLVLGILVFIHELGHFAVAKWTGMRVDEFALGFPPRIFGIKRGETTYAINALPLGGYVKIHGENGKDDEGEPDPRAFNRKSVLARSLVLVAGVTMNLLFAFVVLCIAYTSGFPAISPDLESIPGAKVTSDSALVAGVLPDGAAHAAGIRPGDAILGFKDLTDESTVSVGSVAELQSYTASKQLDGHLALEVELKRSGEVQKVHVTVAPTGPALGVEVIDATSVQVPWYRAPQAAAEVISTISGNTWGALKEFGSGLFQAKLDEKVSGPVGIYKATSSAAQEGVASVVYIMVALSVNLALLNILPIPVLDGGKLLFVFIEAVFRKKVIAYEIENGISTVAFLLLIGLIGLVTLKDVGLL